MAGAAASSTVQLSAASPVPDSVTNSKYATTVPTKARAIPTEPMRMYFHDASTEALVTVSGMSTADAMVVASTATHITATLLAVTATSMVKAKRLAKMEKRRACAAS